MTRFQIHSNVSLKMFERKGEFCAGTVNEKGLHVRVKLIYVGSVMYQMAAIVLTWLRII